MKRADPYRIEPLRSCEHRVAPGVNPPDVVEPAPLPGYALAPFAVSAYLPYRFAALLMVVALLASVAISAVALAELTGLPLVGTLGALLVIDAYVNVMYGETPPFAVAALCVAARYAALGRDRLAAVFASLAMIEPHMGLAACLSLFVWRARTRIVLVAAAALFAAVSVLLLSPRVALAYLLQSLPLMSLAEVPAPDQYSLTWLVHVAGANDALASHLGSLSYAILLVGGVFAAPRAARNLGAPALLVLFPVAATTLLGVFIHDLELPGAVPAALVILAARGPSVRALWLCVFILALEWIPWWDTNRNIVALSILAVGFIAWAAARYRTMPQRLWVACLGPIAYLLVLVVYAHLPHATITAGGGGPWPARVSLGPDAPAALNWGSHIRDDPLGASVQLLVAKLLVWAALAFILFEGIRTRRKLLTVPSQPA